MLACVELDRNDRPGSFAELRQLLEAAHYSLTDVPPSPAAEALEFTLSDWQNQGVAYRALKLYDDAIACYDEILAVDPENVNAWKGKGVALDDQDRFAEAIACYDRALQLDPQDATLYNNKGGTLWRLDRNEEAIECCKRGLDIDPEHGKLWYNYAICPASVGALRRSARLSSQGDSISATRGDVPKSHRAGARRRFERLRGRPRAVRRRP